MAEFKTHAECEAVEDKYLHKILEERVKRREKRALEALLHSQALPMPRLSKDGKYAVVPIPTLSAVAWVNVRG